MTTMTTVDARPAAQRRFGQTLSVDERGRQRDETERNRTSQLSIVRKPTRFISIIIQPLAIVCSSARKCGSARHSDGSICATAGTARTDTFAGKWVTGNGARKTTTHVAGGTMGEKKAKHVRMATNKTCSKRDDKRTRCMMAGMRGS